MSKVKKEINVTEGPFLKKIIVFILPLILTGVLQCLYTAADLAVVGQFRGELALAAVGSTSSLVNLLVALFMGLSVGAAVVVANAIGAGDMNMVRRTVHSSISLSAIVGVGVLLLGIFAGPAMLVLMGTPETVIDQASLYIRIIFLGMPAQMIYNYCAAMVRSSGDTTRPLIFLSISGVVNVILNLVFVALCGMGVEGVAIATVTSQYLSAVMILVHMHGNKNGLSFSFRELRLEWSIVKRVLYIGIPSGLQSSLFSLSNVILQSAVNSLGDIAVAGNTASSNLEGFVYIAMNSVSHASTTFVGQNIGARKYENVKRITIQCAVCAFVIGVIGSGVMLLLREPLLGIYIKDTPEALASGIERMFAVLTLYFLCGIMDSLSGALRSMGKSISAMVVSLFFVCGLRMLWVATVFRMKNTVFALFVSYPVSWFLACVFDTVLIIVTYKRLQARRNT